MYGIPNHTNQGFPFHRDHYDFPIIGNVGPTFIATLSPHGFIVGLLVFVFTLIVQNDPKYSNVITSSQDNQIKVNTLLC